MSLASRSMKLVSPKHQTCQSEAPHLSVRDLKLLRHKHQIASPKHDGCLPGGPGINLCSRGPLSTEWDSPPQASGLIVLCSRGPLSTEWDSPPPASGLIVIGYVGQIGNTADEALPPAVRGTSPPSLSVASLVRSRPHLSVLLRGLHVHSSSASSGLAVRAMCPCFPRHRVTVVLPLHSLVPSRPHLSVLLGGLNFPLSWATSGLAKQFR